MQFPRYDHIVIVVEENHSTSQIIGNKSAPFINSLAAGGALMTQSYGVAHPSQPNYLALFAGDTFGVDSDDCPLALGSAPNLASELLSAGYSFGGFAEDLHHPLRGRCPARDLRPDHQPLHRALYCRADLRTTQDWPGSHRTTDHGYLDSQLVKAVPNPPDSAATSDPAGC